jgi:DNA-binding MarR family transcriptional regulator
MTGEEAKKLAKTLAAECIAVRVRLMNRIITQLYDHALQPLGLKVNQANILVLLALRGQSSPGDIGRLLTMEKSTVSRNVDRMRQKGWIDILDPAAGGLQVIVVTPKGRDLLTAAQAGWQHAQEKAAALLGEEGVAAVRKLFDRLRKNRK